MLFALVVCLVLGAPCLHASVQDQAIVVPTSNALERARMEVMTKQILEDAQKHLRSPDGFYAQGADFALKKPLVRPHMEVMTKQILEDAQKHLRSPDGFYTQGADFALKNPWVRGGNLENVKESCRTCSPSKPGTEQAQEDAPALEKNAQMPQRPSPQAGDLLIFVSFSMPQESLKALMTQAQKHGVRVVMRGLIENSWKKTREKLSEIGLPIEIDPEAFQKYGVSAVPTFVKVTHDGFDSLGGNVTLDYALEVFSSKDALQ